MNLQEKIVSSPCPTLSAQPAPAALLRGPVLTEALGHHVCPGDHTGIAFPTGTSMASRPTRGKQGHLVSWLLRGQHPPPSVLPLGMQGHGCLGPIQISRRIIAKQRHRSAGDTAQPGSPARPMAVSMGARRQQQGPAHPSGAGAAVWVRPSPSCTLGPGGLSDCTFLSCICLAGTQRSPINTWPGPRSGPGVSSHRGIGRQRVPEPRRALI